LDAEDVVVRREEMHRVDSRRGWFDGNSDLGVVNTRKVACTGRLVFFRLEGERVRVHTWVRATGVVRHRLHLVEIFTGLFLESVLAVEDKLELVERTNSRGRAGGTFFNPSSSGGGIDERSACTLGDRGILTTSVGLEDHGSSVCVGREVPESGIGRATFREAPDQFLDRVVEGQSHLLRGSGRDGISTRVLNLFDEVFMTLLRESAAFFCVEVDVVAPNLEAAIGVMGEFAREIEVEADFVVLEGNERQVKTRVAVEEEDQWEEHVIIRRRRHLRVVRLLGFVQVQLGVQTPPALVVLIDALTTDAEFHILDSAFGDPVAIESGACLRRQSLGHQMNIHFPDQVTVTRDGDRDATVVSGRTVDGLFDVFHREVSVTLVDSLEESNLGVTRQIDVLSAISYELHEATSHCEFLYYIARFFFRLKSQRCEKFLTVFSLITLKCQHPLKLLRPSTKLMKMKMKCMMRISRWMKICPNMNRRFRMYSKSHFSSMNS